MARPHAVGRSDLDPHRRVQSCNRRRWGTGAGAWLSRVIAAGRVSFLCSTRGPRATRRSLPWPQDARLLAVRIRLGQPGLARADEHAPARE